MNHNFICVSCLNEIQCDISSAGEKLECPFCGTAQIVPDQLLSPGTILDFYRIERAVETNILWNSYRALDLKFSRGMDVLIRIPSPYFLKNITDFDKFADFLITHGNIGMKEFPVLSDRSLHGKIPYFVYERCGSAPTLSEFSRQSSVELGDALTIVRKTASALNFAARKNLIVHQNLTPTTIRIIVRTLDVYIMEMGLSRFLLKDQKLMGSDFSIWDPRYMSPEFATLGLGDTPLCDIYSMGGVLYFMLTGGHPFKNVDVGRIPITPVDDPRSYSKDIPEAVVDLIYGMMEKNPAKRLQSWEEVIGRIDEILKPGLQQKGLELKGNFNLWNEYVPKNTKSVAATGTVIGLKQQKYFTSKIVRQSVAPALEKEKEKEQSAPAARLLVKKTPRKVELTQQQPEKEVDYTRILIYLCAMLVGLGILIFVLQSSQKPGKDVPTKEDPGVAADASAGERKFKPSPTLDPAPAPDAAPAPAQPAPSAKAVPKQPSKYQEKLAEAEKYFSANPEDLEGAIAKYEELKRVAMETNNINIVLDLNDKISEIEKMRTARIEQEMVKLTQKANELVAAGDTQQAIRIVQEYEGKYADQTKRQRGEMIRQIQAGEALREVNKGKGIRLLEEAMQKNVENVIKGEYAPLKEALAALAADKDAVEIKGTVESILKQLELAEKTTAGESAKKAGLDTLRKKIDDAELQDKSFAMAIICLFKEEYQKAAEYFSAMPFSTGILFVGAAGEMDAKNALVKLLWEFGFKFNPDDKEAFLRSLSEKTISPANCKKLQVEIQNYSFKFGSSDFFAANRNIIDAVAAYCAKIADTDKGVKSKRFIIPQEDGTLNLGRELLKVLEKASNDTEIILKKGYYTLEERKPGDVRDPQRPSTGSFNLDLAGLKLIGEEGVIFEDSLVITAQSVEISNITMTRGRFSIMSGRSGIMPGSGNIVISNCVFDGEETSINGIKGIVFENCFMKGMSIVNCKDVKINRCTIVSQLRGSLQQGALWLEGGNTEINDSIIYGRKYYAVVFSEKLGADQRELQTGFPSTIAISNTIIYGEEGFGAYQCNNDPINEKNIARTQAKFQRYCKEKSNIYAAPQFVNPAIGNWRLVKGTVGHRGGVPKYKGGPIYVKNIRETRDLGRNWPADPEAEPQPK